jgi:hypothetical protein
MTPPPHPAPPTPLALDPQTGGPHVLEPPLPHPHPHTSPICLSCRHTHWQTHLDALPVLTGTCDRPAPLPDGDVVVVHDGRGEHHL